MTLETAYHYWLNIANMTTNKSNLYGCSLLLNQLHPESENVWGETKKEYYKDIGHKLPYPLRGEFLREFKIYLVKKILIKTGYAV